MAAIFNVPMVICHNFNTVFQRKRLDLTAVGRLATNIQPNTLSYTDSRLHKNHRSGKKVFSQLDKLTYSKSILDDH